jgi:hypothetical protein
VLATAGVRFLTHQVNHRGPARKRARRALSQGGPNVDALSRTARLIWRSGRTALHRKAPNWCISLMGNAYKAIARNGVWVIKSAERGALLKAKV